MSEEYRFHVRATKAFRRNTQDVITALYALGVRDSDDLSSYVREAIREKRDRDMALLESVKEPVQSAR